MFLSDTILIFGLPIVIAIHGVTKKHRFTWEWAVVSVYVMSVLIAFINSIIFPMIFQTLSEMSGSPGLANGFGQLQHCWAGYLCLAGMTT